MRKIANILLLVNLLVYPVNASDYTAPEVFDSGKRLMPEASTFGEGLMMIIEDIVPLIRPDLYEASRVCIAIVAAVLLCSLLKSYSEPIKNSAAISCTAAVASALFLSTNSMISLAADTITDLCEYGKLLLPVMTGAMAAQGAVGTSAALYAGATVFISIAGTVIEKLFLPFIYLYLALSVAAGATDHEMIRQIRDLLNSAICWGLKTLLTLFITYMGMTGIVSGTVDAAALKATKATISFAIPVVGGVLSDASEAVLVSVALAKNAAGLYGIFAVLSMFLGPILRIGCHYFVLKLTSAVCSVFGSKNITGVIMNFSSAMGLLLGMTGSVCLLLLIGTVCFLKGTA